MYKKIADTQNPNQFFQKKLQSLRIKNAKHQNTADEKTPRRLGDD